MGKPVASGQALQILSVLALNTDWSQFDADDLQRRLVDKPKEAGAAFTAWLKEGSSTVAPIVKPPTLVLHKTTTFGDIKSKKTNNCFTDDRWGYRDSDIDEWLPAQQKNEVGASISVYQLQNRKGSTFRQMALAVLKVSIGTRDDVLAKLFMERGFTFTLSAIEQMVEMQEGGEDVGLRTDGWANFAFVENKDGSVSVLRVYRGDRRWGADVYRLGRGRRWFAEGRLLLRNSDASTL